MTRRLTAAFILGSAAGVAVYVAAYANTAPYDAARLTLAVCALLLTALTLWDTP